MNKQQVDARVQAAIENLQAKRTVEDDAGIEFKREWPDLTTKARQLAGAANALRGEPLLMVIGVDDKTGAVTTPERQEPQEWYAKASKCFDQVAPELLRLQTVFIGDGEVSVQVLIFDTSEFPYVINDGNRREVPLRVASGTESARRNQLVRMFQPSVRAPSMAIREVVVRAKWHSTPKQVDGSNSAETVRILGAQVELFARVLVEHFGREPTTLPVRDMRARLICGEHVMRPEVHVAHLGGDALFPMFVSAGDPLPPDPVPPMFGVYALDNHVVATAPGEFKVNTSVEYPHRPAPDAALSALHETFSTSNEMRLDLALRVVGVDRLVKLTAPLARKGEIERIYGKGLDGEVQRANCLWTLQADAPDPWSDLDDNEKFSSLNITSDL